MGIKYIKSQQIGLVGSPITQWIIETDDTLAEVTAPGYLNSVSSTNNFSDKDCAVVNILDYGTIPFRIVVSEDSSVSLKCQLLLLAPDSYFGYVGLLGKVHIPVDSETNQIVVNDELCASNTIISLSFESQTTPAVIRTITPSDGYFTITCDVSPGASSINYSFYY